MVRPDELAALLGVTLPPDSAATVNGSAGGSADQTVEQVSRWPSAVTEALTKMTGDRSADTMRIVGACKDSGLTLAQTRWVVNGCTKLAERLAERTDDDVLTCWLKAIDARQNEAWPDNLRTAGANDGIRTQADAVADAGQGATPTTWEPLDLQPYLSGEVELPKPSVGLARSDGLKLLYAGREHAAIGETESGKTWLALQCVAAELLVGNTTLYAHYEEGDPSSTIERLRLLGVPDAAMVEQLRFVAPSRALADVGWLDALLADPTPTLVVHDGVNEAMALHGLDIMAPDGWAAFRRRLVTPACRAGAAVLSCDHLPKNRDGQERGAFGTVHKGNALDGARFVLENVEPFGRGMRGRSNVFVTKDRPAHLRANGRPSKVNGKTFIGTLVADDADTFEPFSLCLYAPKDDGDDGGGKAELKEAVFDVMVAAPERFIESKTRLDECLRDAGHKFRPADRDAAIEDLILANRVEEVDGPRGAKGYRALTSSRDSDT